MFTHIIVGGGSAGSVLAARLSETLTNKVCLIEAGPDYTLEQAPPEILDSYAGHVLASPQYFWPHLKVCRGEGAFVSEKGRRQFKFEQARIIGGGSTVNGQVAVRGAEADFDRWHELGATGWDWQSVLPYFRKLESDQDYVDQRHGNEGPIAISRYKKDQWDEFTLAVAGAWEKRGFKFVPDMNGEFEEGYSPLPLSNDGQRRVSTALGYLTPEVRNRRNLQIRTGVKANKVLFDNDRATGVEVVGPGGLERINGGIVILSAGVFQSPHLLMLSGIGPGQQLQSNEITVLRDLPGVGRNLQDHPSVAISGYLSRATRRHQAYRRNYTYLRYSSNVPGCDPIDMVTMAVCRSAWHELGSRLGTVATYLGKPYSRGWVRLRSPDPDQAPQIVLNWLDDSRDRERMVKAFISMATIIREQAVAAVLKDPFPSSYSERVRKIGVPTTANRFLTNIAALLMDMGGPVRRGFINNMVLDGPTLDQLLANGAALVSHVVNEATTAWHPCGTCKMGDPEDPMTVTDARGKVVGVTGLYVADASIMPEIPRTNLNLPSIMIGEKIAVGLK